MSRWSWGTRRVLVVLTLLWAAAAMAQQPADDGTKVKLLQAGKYAEALALQRALAATIEEGETAEAGKPGTKTAEALGSLAWYALFAREFTEALSASGRALSLAPELLWIETNRAHALLFLGRVDEARAAYLEHKSKRPKRRDTTIWEDVIEEDFAELRKAGLDHPAFDQTLAALGLDGRVSRQEITALGKRVSELYNAGKQAEAVPIAESYVSLARRRYGEDRPPFAAAITWLALLRKDLAHYSEAEPLYKRALAIYETALGSDHPDVATALNNLGKLYEAQGRRGEAELVYRRGLDIAEKAYGSDHPDIATQLDNLGTLLRMRGSFREAEPLLRRALALRQKALGSDHPRVATSLNSLGAFYQAQGRYAEAEPFYKDALAVREKALGSDHLDMGASLSALAGLHIAQGRYPEAEPLYQRVVTIYEKALGDGHPWVAIGLGNLGVLYKTQGRYAEAEVAYTRALAIGEKVLGLDHPDVGIRLNNLAELYRAQGRYADAEPLFKRAIAIGERAFGPDHPGIGAPLSNLGGLYQDQGRYAEAEAAYRRSLAIGEKVLGPDHPDVGGRLNNLAVLYHRQRRYSEAEPFYRRSIVIREKALGADHPEVAVSLVNMAKLHRYWGRYGDAEASCKRALSIFEKALGSEHPRVGPALNTLADIYQDRGRLAEAEALYRRSLSIAERALGLDHTDVSTALNGLAGVYLARHRYADAMPLYERALAIAERAQGADHPGVGTVLSNMAEIRFLQRDWRRSADLWRRNASIVIARARRGVEDVDQALLDRQANEPEQQRQQFLLLVKAAHRLATQEPTAEAGLMREMFEAAQWAQGSKAARSLAQMAVRSAGNDPALASLVRERQDLVGEWQAKDKTLTAARSEPPARRQAQAEAALFTRLAAIDKRLAEIDARLRVDFPDYAGLSRPSPLSLEEVQAMLSPAEALLLFLDTPASNPTPEEIFIWVVTRTQARWVRIELGSGALIREVVALRCGLDAAAWHGDWPHTCRNLLNIGKAPTEGDPLPFDLARAHRLYHALFGQVEDLIKGKHLLVAPSGPLTQLPFQVLVTEAPSPDTGSQPEMLSNYRNAAWLAKRHAVTVLPAISSLKALRHHAKASQASKLFIGFGNPLLDGPDASYQPSARLAREKQACPRTAWQRVAGLLGLRSGARAVRQRNGLAEVADIRALTPLPETADELCAVARSLGVPDGDIRLGAGSSEREVKVLSGSGRLAAYRIVHFATHGTLAGELTPGAEPGLVLTPPEKATAEDDGYLAASEIAALKLDAHWVILSACNTAAGEAKDAEALSGLARAFFYAGARALLVSHWAVYSNATVKLITKTLGTMASDTAAGRSEALRSAMLALIETGEPHEAHPAFWAPFVVVGEGAR